MHSIEEQLVESSKELADLMVKKIGNSQELLDEIMELVYRDEYPVSMRAGWVAFMVIEKHPELGKNHLKTLIRVLPKTKVDGVKRSALKILVATPYQLDEDSLGELADTAFSLAEDPKQAIAVRAFSLDILLKILNVYPEIKPELIAVMESIIPDGSRGLKNKCRKTIAKLKAKK